MSDFLELTAFRKDRDGNWKPVRIDGWARKNDKGGLSVTMYTIPAAENGEVRFVIQKPRDRDSGSQGSRSELRGSDPRADQGGNQRGSGGSYDDSEIPFAPEVR